MSDENLEVSTRQRAVTFLCIVLVVVLLFYLSR
jgi:hypothetical protein